MDYCNKIFSEFKPTLVFHLAAKVGGIHANANYKAIFIDNVLINTNVINACIKNNVEYVFAMGLDVRILKLKMKHFLKRTF